MRTIRTTDARSQLIKFSGVATGQACTVVIRGSTTQMVDEAERSLHDALSVLSQTTKETRTVLGGGCSEMLMSCAVEEAAKKVSGKKAIAVESFARALRQVSCDERPAVARLNRNTPITDPYHSRRQRWV